MKLRPLLMTVTNAANCGLFQVYTEVRIFEDYLCHLAQKKKSSFLHLICMLLSYHLWLSYVVTNYGGQNIY